MAPFDYRAYVTGLSAAQKAELDRMIEGELQAQLSIRKIEGLRRWSPRGYQEPFFWRLFRLATIIISLMSLGFK